MSKLAYAAVWHYNPEMRREPHVVRAGVRHYAAASAQSDEPGLARDPGVPTVEWVGRRGLVIPLDCKHKSTYPISMGILRRVEYTARRVWVGMGAKTGEKWTQWVHAWFKMVQNDV